MGGKPGTLKKNELVKEVHKLLLSKFDEKKSGIRSSSGTNPVGADESIVKKGRIKWTGRINQMGKNKACTLQPLDSIANNPVRCLAKYGRR